MIHRRGFLAAMLAAGVAPAFVRNPMKVSSSGLFLPAKGLFLPEDLGEPVIFPFAKQTSPTTAELTWDVGVGKAVTYQYRVGGGQWLDAGRSNKVVVTGLTPGKMYDMSMRIIS